MINKNEFEATKLVTKVINLSEKELRYSNEVFNIAYGVDKNFLFGTGVSIASILMHNENMDFHFHVFTDFFDDKQESLFSQLGTQYDTKITFYLLEREELKKLPTTQNWSYATYFRFIIVNYFSLKIDKLLYLDADIFCNGSISELTKITFKSNKIAAVVQEGGKAKFTSIDANSKGEKYFNAGFLLINIQQWQKENISRQAINLLLERNFTFLDQDVLNLLLIDKVIFLKEKWNTIYSLDDEMKGNIKRKIRENSILIHYIGHTKPWHKWANPALIQPFIIAKNASPWKSIPFKNARNAHLSKYNVKHALDQKKYLTAFNAYLHYLCKKYADKINCIK